MADPTDGALQVVLAARLAQARQYAAAGSAFEKAVNNGEHAPDVWLAWSATMAANGDRARSWAVLRLAEKTIGSVVDIESAIGRCKALDANTEAAALAATILPAGPESLLAHYCPVTLFDSWNQWVGRFHPNSTGTETRAAWVRQDPENPRLQLLWAEALLKNEQYGFSEAAFQKVLQLDPANLQAKLGTADCLYYEGNLGKSGLMYIECYHKDPKSLRALLGLGQVAIEKHLLGMSVDVFQRAVKLAPNSTEAWIGLGRAYFNQSLDISKSLDAYAKAMKLSPKRTDFYIHYADALRINAQYAEAEAILRKRIIEAPDEARTHHFLAMNILAHNTTQERKSEAESELRTAMKLDPPGAASAALLGRLLVEMGRPTEAVPMLNLALSVDPHDLAATISLARAYRGTGASADAKRISERVAEVTLYNRKIKDLEDALQREPLNMTLYQRMSDLYISGGEPEKAKNYRDAAIMLKRDPQLAQRGLKSMERATYNTIPVPGPSPNGSKSPRTPAASNDGSH